MVLQLIEYTYDIVVNILERNTCYSKIIQLFEVTNLCENFDNVYYTNRGKWPLRFIISQEYIYYGTQQFRRSNVDIMQQKFQSVESEASRGSEVLKDTLGSLKGKVQEALEEASKSDIAKKAGQLTEGLGKTAREAAETLSEQSQKLGKTGAFQTVSETAKIVKKELDEGGIHAHVYRPPARLRKRVETSEDVDDKVIEPNTKATGMELHKDSKFYQNWQNFKDNNPYVNKVLDWKIKYDESDNPVIRASRLLTDKVSDIVGGLFQKTELSETLTEICKLDPSFDKIKFLRDCEQDIIPNILEAIVQGDLEILRDWCYEAPFNLLATPIRQAAAAGYRLDSKILDIDNVDLAMGKVMDQGPVLIVTFTSQQILCARDNKNNVVEGDPDKILRVHYVWVLCRDRAEVNPRAAWKLLDLSASSTEQFV
ncbi:mitochondrial import inner membrane translocase subunit TIM44 isoform X3 [Zootermopsis nevadensis]|uniref:mitochondrial import inner membrane translocase subunit TIM44 isoform X3 n=1 Tax=Zootermopsis nevadensis TaxID=136037 RepID=UPI000B8E9246|nr:mitochondrial import inner membrane translocase subunit TIM44 isoform X3 [Zootermopsis nevadensis]